jgi:hypothetical protein
MSVEKLVISKQSSGYTTLDNKVLQGLNDIGAIGLWCYLSSLPPNWIFYKQQIRNHFNIGRDRLDSLLETLKSHHLIKMDAVRNAQGKFAHSNLIVCNGTEFVAQNEYNTINNLDKTVQPHTEKPLTVNQLPVTSSYKDNKKKQTIKKETVKLLSATDVAQATPPTFFFDEFWKNYPRKRNKARALQIWKRKKYDDIATMILEDVRNRLANDSQWLDVQYIPHPSTYLLNQRWEDELTLTPMQPKKETNAERIMRMCLN